MCAHGPRRIAKALAALLELIRTFPVDSPVHEGLFDHLEQTRAKFRLVATQLGSGIRYAASTAPPLSF